MSFLKKVFKAKEGGTLVGNLIRGAANKATGGILGNGVMLDMATKKITPAAGAAQMQMIAGTIGNAAFSGAMATKEGSMLAGSAAKMGLEYYLETYKIQLLAVLIAIGAFFAFRGSKTPQKYKKKK